MKTMSAVLFVLLLVSLTHAQQMWTRTYGGTGDDEGYSVQQTTDGGYIVAGLTWSFGDSSQFYVVKTNAFGDTLWTKNFGGTGVDIGWSVQQTSDTGYIVAGYTNSFGNGLQVYLIKINAFGDTLWTKTYGGTNSDRGYSIQQTSDGGYIVAGMTNSFGNSYQVYLIKTNAFGDTLWTRTYGGAGSDMGNSVQQTSDGGYIVAGFTNSFGNGYQVYLVKTNDSGDTLWTRTYGGAGDEFGYSVQQTSDTGYIVTGNSNSFGNDYQVYLVKANASGDTLWTRTYGGMSGEVGYSVQQTTDGGYIIAGATSSFGADSGDFYLIKTNTSGDTLWTRTYGGAGTDGAYSVQQTTDGGYIIAGETDSYGHANGYSDVYLIKTDGNGNVGNEEQSEVRGKKLEGRITAKPNPFTSFVTVPGHEGERFSLYDISGRRVGNYLGDRIGEDLSPGIYFLKHQEMLKQPMNQVQGMVQHDEIVRIVKVR